MSGAVVVRYAPSPTGALHLGGLRTALFNYAFAKAQGGAFLLRIEDTDQSRTVPGASDELVRVLKQCGLHWSNEVVEFQSNRLALYHSQADKLMHNRHAYRCFCSKERLDALRKGTSGGVYDRLCLSLSESEVEEKVHAGEPHTVRMVAPEGGVRVKDTLRGDVNFPLGVIDDQILVKSDGMPTYHLASVVDDHHMGVTHVIRGEEWLSSAPKHVALYDMFGWSVPSFTHLPLLLNKEGAKLSKRHGDVAVQDFLDKGYLPSAVVNFVALLGWTPPVDPEAEEDDEGEGRVCANWSALKLDEIVEAFDLNDVNKSPGVVDIDRLNHINSEHIQLLLTGKLGEEAQVRFVEEFRKDLEIDPAYDDEYLLSVLHALISRARVTGDLKRLCAHFFAQEIDINSETVQAVKREVWLEEASCMLQTAHDRMNGVEESQWTEETIRRVIKECTKEICGSKKKQSTFLLPLRWALTGMSVGAPLPRTLCLLGRQRVMSRLQAQFNHR